MPARRLLATFTSTLLLASVLTLAAPQVVTAHPAGSFAVECPFSHTLKDDPIVHPGMPGMSHRHAFYGNRSTNANSTYRSMLDARTTCTDGDPPKDKAATWFPTVMFKKHGEWRNANAYRVRVYYFPSIRPTLGETANLPPNLKMIAGNPEADSYRQNPDVRWFCGEGSPERGFPYDCTDYTNPKEDGIRAIISMPYCWDGENKDSPDHRSHVIYPDPKSTDPHEKPVLCPESHPINIPLVSIRAHWSIKDPCAGAPCNPKLRGKNVKLKLSSGPWWTMHADFWNTWVQSRLNALTEKCLRGAKNCGILGQ